MSAVDTAKIESWRIQRWNSHPDLAAIFQHLHDTHASGRLMLHIGNGRVIAAEFCARDTDDSYLDSST